MTNLGIRYTNSEPIDRRGVDSGRLAGEATVRLLSSPPWGIAPPGLFHAPRRPQRVASRFGRNCADKLGSEIRDCRELVKATS
jgi:hypothetical protein